MCVLFFILVSFYLKGFGFACHQADDEPDKQSDLSFENTKATITSVHIFSKVQPFPILTQNNEQAVRHSLQKRLEMSEKYFNGITENGSLGCLFLLLPSK